MSGITCLLAALCYAEFAAMSPSAGSAYAYARGTMGEVVGWIIGWDLCLEYGVAAATVAQSWSSHFAQFVALCGGNMADSKLDRPFWSRFTPPASATSTVLAAASDRAVLPCVIF